MHLELFPYSNPESSSEGIHLELTLDPPGSVEVCTSSSFRPGSSSEGIHLELL